MRLVGVDTFCPVLGLFSLSLMDLSAAFDTVDHHTLLQWLQTFYGYSRVVLTWFTSYLTGHTQFIRTSLTALPPLPLVHGVPQGSVLGLIVFLLYVVDLLQLIIRHQLVPYAYTDDTQIYGFCRPCDIDALFDRMSACTDEASWLRANRLQANPSKTEVLWCSSGRCQHQIPTMSVPIGNVDILLVSSVHDLGIYVDFDVTMRSHLTAIVRSCFDSMPLVSHQNSTHPARQTINLGRPFIPCRCSTGMEQSTVSCTNFTVTHHLPTRTENISLPLELRRLLVTNALFHIL